MRLLSTKKQNFAREWGRFLQQTATVPHEVERAVARILSQVRCRGDAALFAYTRQFDRFTVSARNLRVTPGQVGGARRKISAADYATLKRAAARIRRFHKRQPLRSWSVRSSGGRMGLSWRPLERVGIYVPGGEAAYPSTVLMNAVPAVVAGVREIAMVTPTPAGSLNPYVLAAADIVGIREIYRVGGAQAIAALAFGTKSIGPVDKIVGPGNRYVAAAKRQVYGEVAIDMVAGPTEVVIVADASAKPAYVAADLLSQAEHDRDARPLLISLSEGLVPKVQEELLRFLRDTPRRQVVAQALNRNGLVVLARNRREAIALINEIAPEHLELMVRRPQSWLAAIRNAGAIFLGSYTPVAAGDYTAGPNHVLPTARTARFASPLGVYDFMKASSWLELSQKGLDLLSPDIVRLAEMEGLTAHGKSVLVRKES